MLLDDVAVFVSFFGCLFVCLLVLFSFYVVYFFFLFFLFFSFLRDGNIVSISTAECRYYALIILVNLGKP